MSCSSTQRREASLKLKSVGIFAAVWIAAFVLAGCGGAGTQTCALYDQGSAAYFVARGPGSSKEAHAVCSHLSREFSTELKRKWTTQKNSKIDYSHDIRVCRKRIQGGELDLYDSRSGYIGKLLCAALATVSH